MIANQLFANLWGSIEEMGGQLNSVCAQFHRGIIMVTFPDGIGKSTLPIKICNDNNNLMPLNEEVIVIFQYQLKGKSVQELLNSKTYLVVLDWCFMQQEYTMNITNKFMSHATAFLNEKD